MPIKAGDVFLTKEGCKLIVVSFKNSSKILIEFLDKNKHQLTVRSDYLKKCNIKNPFHPSVYGFGMYGSGIYKSTAFGKRTPAYETWKHMLCRCYNADYLEKNPTYNFCSVCPEWLNFQSFAEWFEKEPSSGKLGFNLDKDLRKVGNKIYSPSTCSFVPYQINSLLTDHGLARGLLPQGVNAVGRMFGAQIRVNGKLLYLGKYVTPDLAFQAYRKAKEANVKLMAEEWKEYLHSEVYSNLASWKL